MKKSVLFLLAFLLLSPGVFRADDVSTSSAPAKISAPASVPKFKTTLPPLVVPKEEVYQDSRGLLDRLRDSAYTNFVKEDRWRYLLDGFITTMLITVCSAVLGILIGFLVAVIRSIGDQTGRLKLLNLLCKIYLTVIRGTPVVVQLLIIYFVIFGPFDVNKVVVAIIAFGVNSGAYVAEIVRGGINAVDPGQMEAGCSLGLTYLQTMRLIILPQAFKNVLPALGNEFISLLKETSISGYIALQDITKGGDIIRSQTYDAFLPLTAVALTYLAIVMLFTWLLGILERNLKKNER
ncbi:MAG: amino acid ABC transporter permease [Lentisphaeria bacterium]|nr:amino acid ABC transporter permease [Lentisphaeria bacterium]